MKKTPLRLVQVIHKATDHIGIPYMVCDMHYRIDRATKIRQGFDDLVIIRNRKNFLVDEDGYYHALPHYKCCMCHYRLKHSKVRHIEMILSYRDMYEDALKSSKSFEESVDYKSELQEIEKQLQDEGIIAAG